MPEDRGDNPIAPRARVAVVGAGISGLAVAWRLLRAADTGSADTGSADTGLEVILLEQSPAVGGKLVVGDVGGVEVDLGAESVLARRPEATDLFIELGLADEVVHPVTAAANVLRDGRIVPLPGGTLMGVPGDPRRLGDLLTPQEVARVALEPERGAVAVRDDIDVASWVGARVGPAVVDHLVEPLLGGVYAGHARELSLRATIPALWPAAAQAGSLLEAVRRALPAAGPDPTPPVFAGLRGGVGRLPGVLADAVRAAGGTVRTGVTVRGLDRTAGGWRVLLGPASAPEHLEVDAVVLAVPPAAAARLLSGPAPAAARALAGIETASVAVVAALVPRPSLAGIAGSGLLVPPVTGHPVKALTFSAAKWAWVDAQRPDHVLVRLSIGRHREEALLQRDDADLCTVAIADAEAILRRPLAPVATRVVRWGGGLPQFAVGHVERVARIRAELGRVGGLALCGAALDGVGVPACLSAATRAATDILEHLGRVGQPGRGGRRAGDPGAGRQ